MKNLFLFSASVAALLAVGCNKLPVPSPEVTTDENGYCELKLCLADNALTKVTGDPAAGETVIRNVQIFVFRAGADDKSSMLDACLAKGFDTALSASGTYSDISLKCTVGKRHIYAIVNADANYTSDGSVGTLADLLAKTMMLSGMNSDMLLMTGCERGVTLNALNQTQTVKVYRSCASVILQSVKNEMQSAVYQKAASFIIKKIYLTNVPARINFGMTLPASSLKDENAWYARQGAETVAGNRKLIYDELSSDAYLEYKSVYNTQHTFYTFPNDCADVSGGSWSPRATRLVIEAKYSDGTAWHDCYYPITLYKSGEGLEANRQYKVNLTINRPGSDDPDKPVEFSTLSGTITVANWENGTTYTETI